MREGTTLAELVNGAGKARGWHVEARPIWLSRHVASLAALNPADGDSLCEFIQQRYQLTVRQLLETLHLTAGDVPSVAEILDSVLDNDRIVRQVRGALTETPHLRNRLTVTVTRARERLLTELRRVGALDDHELTLVDLGWGGTIQYYLAHALRLADVNIRPAGYYLATDDRSARVYHSGLSIEGYLGAAGHPREVVATLTRSPEVIEQCVNDLCGSLIGFDDNGSPVLGPHSDSASQELERRAVQSGIFAFQQLWNRYANSHTPWPTLVGEARQRLANVLTAAVKRPTEDEAAVFGNWGHEDNFGSSVITRILPDDLAPAIPYMSPGDLADLHMRDAFWPAVIAASDVRLAAAARALAVDQIDIAAFEPSDAPYYTRVRFQTADGTWRDGPRQRVRINQNGLSFARMDFRSESGDVSHVALAIPGRPAIVRIDWIGMEVTKAGSPASNTLRWDQPRDFAGLVHADCTWLGGNMIEFEHDDSAVWLPVAARVGGPVSSARITVAFAMLPKSRTGLGRRMPPAPRIIRLSSRVREEYKTRGAAGLAAAIARVASRQIGGTQ